MCTCVWILPFDTDTRRALLVIACDVIFQATIAERVVNIVVLFVVRTALQTDQVPTNALTQSTDSFLFSSPSFLVLVLLSSIASLVFAFNE